MGGNGMRGNCGEGDSDKWNQSHMVPRQENVSFTIKSKRHLQLLACEDKKNIAFQ